MAPAKSADDGPEGQLWRKVRAKRRGQRTREKRTTHVLELVTLASWVSSLSFTTVPRTVRPFWLLSSCNPIPLLAALSSSSFFHCWLFLSSPSLPRSLAPSPPTSFSSSSPSASPRVDPSTTTPFLHPDRTWLFPHPFIILRLVTLQVFPRKTSLLKLVKTTTSPRPQPVDRQRRNTAILYTNLPHTQATRSLSHLHPLPILDSGACLI